MQKFMHMTKSIFFKLFVTFSLILLPLLATQSAMYHWGREAVTTELDAAAMSNVVYLRDNFVTAVDNINIQLEYLLGDSDISNFFVNNKILSQAEYYMQIMKINKLLALISKSNPYISEIQLYYPSCQIVLSSEKKVSTVSIEEMETLLNDFYLQNTFLAESGEDIFILRTYPTTVWQQDVLPPYFIKATLKQEKIQEHLSSFSQYSNKNAFMINHNTGSILAGEESLLCTEEDLAALQNIALSQNGESVYSHSYAEVNGSSYTAVSCYSARIHCSFIQLIPSETLQAIPNSFRSFILFFNLLAILVVLSFSVILYHLVKHPANDLMAAFSVAGRGDFSVSLKPHYSYEYNELVVNFNSMTKHIKLLIQTNYEQKILLQHAELKQLQAQINPHFLYNSFFFLRHMIGQRDNQEAVQFVSYLSKYFQFITRNGQDTVTLEEEYSHSVNYLSIQLMRFDGLILSDIQPLPEAFREIVVPRLMLQPIFENAIEHGIQTNEGNGLIRLRFEEKPQGFFVILVEDNGSSLSDDMLSLLQNALLSDSLVTETTGLLNIQKRLQLYFADSRCGLQMQRSELGGLCVRMTLKNQGRKTIE